MAKLGAPIEIDAKTRERNRIYRVGIELEGGWTKLPKGCSGLTRDTSVRLPNNTTETGEPLHIGELPSRILTLDELRAWLKANYPQVVNASCGMHVHMSMRTAMAYSRLMDPRYPATIIQCMTKWAEREKLPSSHPIWPRLQGKCEYCQHLYTPDEQATVGGKDFDHHRTGHRYTVINYCYIRNATVECRLLPMMSDHDQAYRAIREIIDVTNAFLVKTAKREDKVSASVEDTGGELNEERRITV